MQNSATKPKALKKPLIYSSKLSELEISYQPPPLLNKIRCLKDASDFMRQVWDEDLINIQEQFYALFLNTANDVLGWRLLNTGNGNCTLLDMRLLACIACKTLAHNVIIAHNHPSGSLKPSERDKDVTALVKKMLMLFDINLIDHIIMTAESSFSFADEGLMCGM